MQAHFIVLLIILCARSSFIYFRMCPLSQKQKQQHITRVWKYLFLILMESECACTFSHYKTILLREHAKYKRRHNEKLLAAHRFKLVSWSSSHFDGNCCCAENLATALNEHKLCGGCFVFYPNFYSLSSERVCGIKMYTVFRSFTTAVLSIATN